MIQFYVTNWSIIVSYLIIFIRQHRIHKNLGLTLAGKEINESQIKEIKLAEWQVLRFFLMICQLLFVESLLYTVREIFIAVHLSASWIWRMSYLSWNIIQLSEALMLVGLRLSIMHVLDSQNGSLRL